MDLIVIDVPTEIYCCCYSSPFCRGFWSKLHFVVVRTWSHRIVPAKCFSDSTGVIQRGMPEELKFPKSSAKSSHKKVGAGGSASLAESGARTGLQRGLFDRAEVASYCKGRRPRPAARKCDRASCRMSIGTQQLFSVQAQALHVFLVPVRELDRRGRQKGTGGTWRHLTQYIMVCFVRIGLYGARTTRGEKASCSKNQLKFSYLLFFQAAEILWGFSWLRVAACNFTTS